MGGEVDGGGGGGTLVHTHHPALRTKGGMFVVADFFISVEWSVSAHHVS